MNSVTLLLILIFGVMVAFGLFVYIGDLREERRHPHRPSR